MQEEARIALFIDFENIALGLRGKKAKTFDVQLILERLLEKGRIIVKRAYADWTRYSEYRRRPARGGDRADRDPHAPADGEELGGHPARRRCAGSLLHEGAPRHLRRRLGRQRLLTARVQAQGEQQAGHRARASRGDERSAGRQLRRVPLLRGLDPDDREGRPRGRCSRRRSRRPSTSSSTRSGRSCARTRKSSGVLDDQGHDQAQEADLQRERLRVPVVQRAARGGGAGGLVQITRDQRSGGTYVVTEVRFG